MRQVQNKAKPSVAVCCAGLKVILFLTIGCEIRPPEPTPKAGPTKRPEQRVVAEPSLQQSVASRYLSGADGEFRLDSFRGRPALVAVLGAGTPHVRDVVATLNRVQDNGLFVVGLLAALRADEEGSHVAASLNATFPIAEATPDLLQGLGGARALPTYLFLDGSGAIRKRIAGAASDEEILAHARDLLADAR